MSYGMKVKVSLGRIWYISGDPKTGDLPGAGAGLSSGGAGWGMDYRGPMSRLGATLGGFLHGVRHSGQAQCPFAGGKSAITTYGCKGWFVHD